ncbi:unnamed protein product [Protopolystoma xenopodis]|uniref:Uncharacterized protein n=1 Tax=Protopolystoma xenopodis TaxID=117903 RepID=A0A448WJX1_9PLAT|nr:unnamed protein product [Protopolystoma xenopodis]
MTFSGVISAHQDRTVEAACACSPKFHICHEPISFAVSPEALTPNQWDWSLLASFGRQIAELKITTGLWEDKERRTCSKIAVDSSMAGCPSDSWPFALYIFVAVRLLLTPYGAKMFFSLLVFGLLGKITYWHSWQSGVVVNVSRLYAAHHKLSSSPAGVAMEKGSGQVEMAVHSSCDVKCNGKVGYTHMIVEKCSHQLLPVAKAVVSPGYRLNVCQCVRPTVRLMSFLHPFNVDFAKSEINPALKTKSGVRNVRSNYLSVSPVGSGVTFSSAGRDNGSSSQNCTENHSSMLNEPVDSSGLTPSESPATLIRKSKIGSALIS